MQKQRGEIEAKQKDLSLAETIIADNQKQTAVLRQALSNAILTIEGERELFQEQLVQERAVWQQARVSAQQLLQIEIANLTSDRSALLEREKELFQRIIVLEEEKSAKRGSIMENKKKKKRKLQTEPLPISLIPTGPSDNNEKNQTDTFDPLVNYQWTNKFTKRIQAERPKSNLIFSLLQRMADA